MLTHPAHSILIVFNRFAQMCTHTQVSALSDVRYQCSFNISILSAFWLRRLHTALRPRYSLQ